MGTISIKGLRIFARHGCHPEERKTGATFVVDIDMDLPIALAAKSDNLHDSVDYVSVMSIVEEVMSTPQNLIEPVAHRISALLLDSFPTVESVKVTIKKPAPPVKFELDYVSVTTSMKRPTN